MERELGAIRVPRGEGSLGTVRHCQWGTQTHSTCNMEYWDPLKFKPNFSWEKDLLQHQNVGAHESEAPQGRDAPPRHPLIAPALASREGAPQKPTGKESRAPRHGKPWGILQRQSYLARVGIQPPHGRSLRASAVAVPGA